MRDGRSQGVVAPAASTTDGMAVDIFVHAHDLDRDHCASSEAGMSKVLLESLCTGRPADAA